MNNEDKLIYNKIEEEYNNAIKKFVNEINSIDIKYNTFGYIEIENPEYKFIFDPSRHYRRNIYLSIISFQFKRDKEK